MTDTGSMDGEIGHGQPARPPCGLAHRGPAVQTNRVPVHGDGRPGPPPWFSEGDLIAAAYLGLSGGGDRYGSSRVPVEPLHAWQRERLAPVMTPPCPYGVTCPESQRARLAPATRRAATASAQGASPRAWVEGPPSRFRASGASEPSLLRWLGEKPSEGRGLGPRRDDDDNVTAGRADRGPFRHLLLESRTLPPTTSLGIPWTIRRSLK